MQSIRWRLFIALLSSFVIAWVIALTYLGTRIRSEHSGLWDHNLSEVADEVLLSMPTTIRHVSSGQNLQLSGHPTLSDKFYRLNFQAWVKADHTLVMRAPHALRTPLKPDFTDGFSTRLIHGKKWRIYAVSDASNQIQVQVGRSLSDLNADLRGWIRVGLITSLCLFLLLGIVVHKVVGWSLSPVIKLERDITQHNTLDLDPLPSGSLPAEVRPLVEAFNQLLHRVDRAVKGERQFLTEAAHELRTPLAAVLTHTQVALRAKNAEELKSCLDQLVCSTERSARLSQQLLDSARLDVERQPNEQELVELADVVTMVTREFEAMARGKYQSLTVETVPCLVDGNVDELGILVGNLIDNALRYTGVAGKVQVSCLREGSLIRLAVRDDGPGVDLSERERIFDRFYRAAGTSERGSGIGLSLVARIAKAHGATIETVEGLHGRGLSVVVTFQGRNDSAVTA